MPQLALYAVLAVIRRFCHSADAVLVKGVRAKPGLCGPLSYADGRTSYADGRTYRVPLRPVAWEGHGWNQHSTFLRALRSFWAQLDVAEVLDQPGASWLELFLES
mgnify:CR=1 FL=1